MEHPNEITEAILWRFCLYWAAFPHHDGAKWIFNGMAKDDPHGEGATPERAILDAKNNYKLLQSAGELQ